LIAPFPDEVVTDLLDALVALADPDVAAVLR
jgi:hypothetical protein